LELSTVLVHRELNPLLATPLSFTRTLPVFAPVGTFVTIDVALQRVIVATVPSNVTVPPPDKGKVDLELADPGLPQVVKAHLERYSAVALLWLSQALTFRFEISRGKSEVDPEGG
jgi:hypothetical protein